MQFNFSTLDKLPVLEALKSCDFDISSDQMRIQFSKLDVNSLTSLPNNTISFFVKGKKRTRFKAGSELSASVNLMQPDDTGMPGVGEELISFTVQYSLKVELKDVVVVKGIE